MPPPPPVWGHGGESIGWMGHNTANQFRQGGAYNAIPPEIWDLINGMSP